MEITIKDTVYSIKYGFRALIIYENIAGESFQPNGLNSIITLFYSCLMAANKNLTIEFNDFVDELDEQPDKLNEFSSYIISMINKNNDLSEKDKSVETKKKQKKVKE